jgi:hypothetical protein
VWPKHGTWYLVLDAELACGAGGGLRRPSHAGGLALLMQCAVATPKMGQCGYLALVNMYTVASNKAPDPRFDL